MTDRYRYPPIDRELRETVWPSVLEHQELTAGLTRAELQAQVGAGAAWWNPDLEQGGRVRASRSTIDASSGGDRLPVLTLTPARESASPRACIYYAANGGRLLQCDTVALTDTEIRWVADLNIVLVSVAPRVGPAHPHPAQVEDAYRGLQWVVDNADELNIDPAHVIVLGKSGGGGIAAGTVLYARDQGGPGIACQMLVYPMIDDRLVTPSSHYDVPPWTSFHNQAGWAAILGDSVGGAGVSPYAAPARAADLAGLPPAYLEVGSSEVFRDETIAYALRLASAGVPIELHSWAGGFHGFEMIAPDAEISRKALDVRTSYLKRVAADLAGPTG